MKDIHSWIFISHRGANNSVCNPSSYGTELSRNWHLCRSAVHIYYLTTFILSIRKDTTPQKSVVRNVKGLGSRKQYTCIWTQTARRSAPIPVYVWWQFQATRRELNSCSRGFSCRGRRSQQEHRKECRYAVTLDPSRAESWKLLSAVYDRAKEN